MRLNMSSRRASKLKTKSSHTLSEMQELGFEVTSAPQETLRREQLRVNLGVVPSLSVFQRFRFHVFGGLFLRMVKPEGYSGAVPVYLKKCSYHGFYLDTPHGNSRYFQCPHCLDEAKEETEKHRPH